MPSQPILSILICSVESRRPKLEALLACLHAQVAALADPSSVEVIDLIDNKEITIGEKRNKLLDMATGKYIVFIDDDDRVWGDYITKILKATESDPDAIGISGIITWDLKNPKMFRHSLDHGKECPIIQDVCNKPPWHICPIRATIAKSKRFEHISFGEDARWAMEVIDLIKTCTHIPDPIYYYDYRMQGSESRHSQKVKPISMNTSGRLKPIKPLLPGSNKKIYLSNPRRGRGILKRT
jgi:glycosyltransferase involved in cell wall biosynthesis